MEMELQDNQVAAICRFYGGGPKFEFAGILAAVSDEGVTLEVRPDRDFIIKLDLSDARVFFNKVNALCWGNDQLADDDSLIKAETDLSEVGPDSTGETEVRAKMNELAMETLPTSGILPEKEGTALLTEMENTNDQGELNDLKDNGGLSAKDERGPFETTLSAEIPDKDGIF